MKQVERSELLPLGEYEQIRDRFRARIIEEKRQRRVALGDRATCIFENHDTVLMQIQEMLRTERITKESAILHELETYNALVPKDDEVSATVMIEIAEAPVREKFLADANGFEDAVSLVVDGEAFPAIYPKSLAPAARTTAVHYFKFKLSNTAKNKLAVAIAKKDGNTPPSVAIVSTHPAYAVRAELTPTQVRSLAEDLS